jgi:hypothetical protein
MPNPASRYSYLPDLGKYRDSKTGRFVQQSKITSLLRRQTTVTQKEMRALSQDLADKKIDLTAWRDGMRDKIKTIQVNQAAAAKGGYDRMTQVDYGRVGGKLRYQYERLDIFASQIQNKAQPLDGRFTQRVDMYAKSGHATYEATRGNVMGDMGADEEINVLHPAEHCQDCLDETARGWQPLGTISQIGSRQCRVNDQCTMRYRNSKTGRIF